MQEFARFYIQSTKTIPADRIVPRDALSESERSALVELAPWLTWTISGTWPASSSKRITVRRRPGLCLMTP